MIIEGLYLIKTEMYNIIIRPVNKIKNYSTGKIDTHTLTQKELLKLNRYLNKYFRYNWQEIKENDS